MFLCVWQSLKRKSGKMKQRTAQFMNTNTFWGSYKKNKVFICWKIKNNYFWLIKVANK